jgi:hypothetical protein
MDKTKRALLHDEVRILNFDDPNDPWTVHGEQETKRPDRASVPPVSSLSPNITKEI